MSFRLPEPLVDQLKATASLEGISMTELIARYSRVGLNLSAEERLNPLAAMLEAGQLSELPGSFQYQHNAIVPSQLYDSTQFETSQNPVEEPEDTASSLLPGFEKFIQLLEKALEEANNSIQAEVQDDMLATIGNLSMLKVRLRSQPYVKQSTVKP